MTVIRYRARFDPLAEWRMGAVHDLVAFITIWGHDFEIENEGVRA